MTQMPAIRLSSKRFEVSVSDAMEELLGAKYKIASFERGAKPDVSRPCPEPIAEDLAARCDVLITAIGD